MSELRVRGGAGGVAAQLEHLDAAVAHLGRSAAALREAAAGLHLGRGLAQGLSDAWHAPGAALETEGSLVRAGAWLGEACECTELLRGGVEAAVGGYRAVEAAADGTWVALRSTAGVLLSPFSLLVGGVAAGAVPATGAVVDTALAGRGGGAPRPGARSREEGAPECAPGGPAALLPPTAEPQRVVVDGAGVPPLVPPPRPLGQPVPPVELATTGCAPDGGGRVGVRLPVGDQLLVALIGTALAGTGAVGARSATPAVARWMVRQAADRGVGKTTGTVVTTRPVPQGAASAGPPRGVADAISRVGDVSDEAGGPRGRVRVERVVQPDGTRAAVLYLPGVADWDLGSPLPNSGGSALRAVAGDPSAYTDTAVRALELAGVEPGEPVMVVGHSLGGVVGVQMAGDPAVRDRFAITAVLTAGSPVGALDVPDDVAVLALEHDRDAVPWADGLDNPDTPGTTTVTAAAPPGVGPHDTEGYRELGRQVDASQHPSVLAWRRAASPFFAAPGASSEVVEAAGRRTGP